MSEVTGRRLVRNTLYNAAGSVVVALVALAITPFLLHRLGPSEYGVWLLATTLTFASGYVALTDLGLQQAAVRFVAEARRKNDVQAMNEVVATTAAAFAGLGLVAALVLAAIAGALTNVFNVAPGLDDEARTVFVLVGVQIAVDLPAAALLSLVEGAQSYGWLRAVEIGARVLWAVGGVAAVALGHGVVALGVVSLGVAVLMLVATWIAARRIEPRLALRPTLVSRATLGRIARYGSSLMVMRVLSVLYRQMDRAIIGIALTTAAVARYEVAYKIHATAAIVLTIAPSAVMPAAAYLGAGGDTARLRALYLRGTKYALALSLPVTIAALLYARALIVGWVGDEYESMTGVTRLFLVYPALVAVHTIGLTMLVGLGRMRETVRLNLISVGLNLVVSVALVDRIGIAGVVWGTLVGYLVIWVPYTRLFLSNFEVPLAQWARETVLPNLPGVAAQLVLGFATLRLVEDTENLWVALAAFGLNCAASVAVFLFGVMRVDERRSLAGTLRRRDGAPSAADIGPIPTQDHEFPVL